MRRRIEEIWIVEENVLCAVPMMDVKIDNRDALDPMGRAGVQRADRNIVEQAEAHGSPPLGVVTGRPHGAESVSDTTFHYRIHGFHDGARRSERGFRRTRRHRCVGVYPRETTWLNPGLENRVDKCCFVHPKECLALRPRTIDPDKIRKPCGAERTQHGLQTLDPLGMAARHEMLKTGGVREKSRGHRTMI